MAKSEHTGVVVAIMGFAAELPSGAEVSVQGGQRLRADHEAVRTHPAFFVADGSTSEEMAHAIGLIEDSRPRPSQPRRFRAKRDVIPDPARSGGWQVAAGTVLE